MSHDAAPCAGNPEPLSLSDRSEAPAAQLNTLRVQIDRIDASMHQLLIERSAIIDELIAIKARQGGGSAFRPGREAEMMRRLAERHSGRLPLDTVESIWRVIISTFTFLQSPYAVHADMAGGDAAMRDCARFHFGFTVPLRPHFGAVGVIEAVAKAEGDLGLLAIEGASSKPAWWMSLTEADAPKVIARLPFVERPDHPAGLPVYVIARPMAAAAVRDVVLVAASLDRWSPAVAEAIAQLGGEVVGHALSSGRVSLLFAISGAIAHDALQERIGSTATLHALTEIGSHAARFEIA